MVCRPSSQLHLIKTYKSVYLLTKRSIRYKLRTCPRCYIKHIIVIVYRDVSPCVVLLSSSTVQFQSLRVRPWHRHIYRWHHRPPNQTSTHPQTHGQKKHRADIPDLICITLSITPAPVSRSWYHWWGLFFDRDRFFLVVVLSERNGYGITPLSRRYLMPVSRGSWSCLLFL
jgi:hypothetical protein